MESRGPHGYGCSSCFIHDKMSCAEIRDSVRGKKAVLEPVPFHRASHRKFEHRHVQRLLLCSEGVWQFGYPCPHPVNSLPRWDLTGPAAGEEAVWRQSQDRNPGLLALSSEPQGHLWGQQ